MRAPDAPMRWLRQSKSATTLSVELSGFRERVMGIRPLVKGGEWLAYGSGVSRRHRELAENVVEGAHEFVLDLGCGDAALLKYVQPLRYVGIDSHKPSLERGRRLRGRPGYEFLDMDISDSLERFRGADVVVCGNFFHHLTDEQVTGLVRRIFEEVSPSWVCASDGVTRGPLRGLLNYVDEGEPVRPKEELFDLLSPYEIKPTWAFASRARTYDLFGFEIRPA